jgi:hypothetical protein
VTNLSQDKPQISPWTEPPPMDTGAPSPAVYSNGHDLLCGYFANSAVEGHLSVALLKFEGVLLHRFGYPNDEVLEGHPLYSFGLEHYGFFLVRNSPLISEIETQNQCHSRHRRGIYNKFGHWIATFHDETLEVLALRALVSWVPDVSSPEQAVCLRPGTIG